MKEERLTPNHYWALARKEPDCRRYDMYASEQQGNLVAIEIWDSPVRQVSLISRFLFSLVSYAFVDCWISLGFKEIALAISIITYSRGYSADLS